MNRQIVQMIEKARFVQAISKRYRKKLVDTLCVMMIYLHEESKVCFCIGMYISHM